MAVKSNIRMREKSLGGFTLMEMMMALLIGAIVLTPLYVITRGMARDTNVQQMETEAIQRARVGMETLITDFQMTGMMASPNPQLDVDSIVSSSAGGTQRAWDRQAVVHLNRDGDTGNDAVLLVGAFENPRLYLAEVGVDSLQMIENFDDENDCLRAFDPDYSFAHVYSTTGQHLDAMVRDVNCNGSPDDCTCVVDLEYSELAVDGPGAFTMGQVVNVSANQAVLYRVDPVAEPGGGTHDALMRYYVDYSASIPNCDENDFNDSNIDLGSAVMIADYVQDFQVWFRTVRQAGGGMADPPVPVMNALEDLPASRPTFLPSEDNWLVGIGDPDNQSPVEANLSCQSAAGNIGPEHVRSAIIRLAVRSEKTDQSLKVIEPNSSSPANDWAALGDIARMNLAPPPAGDVGAYKVRTLMTEVAMPNLAARMASFTGNFPAP